MTITLDEAIEQHLQLARELQPRSSLRATDVIERLVELYNGLRVEGADVDDDGDMLLLQWGASMPLLLNEPRDLRSSSESVQFDQTRYDFLDFTRQIFAPGDNPDADFDDIAVAVTITLFYEPQPSQVTGGNVWIHTPAEVERKLREFYAVSFVEQRLVLSSSRMTSVASLIG